MRNINQIQEDVWSREISFLNMGHIRTYLFTSRNNLMKGKQCNIILSYDLQETKLSVIMVCLQSGILYSFYK